MVWPQTGSELRVSIPLPVLSRTTEPSEEEPSVKITVPAGVPAPPPDAVTAAVNVMGCPKTLGFTELERVVMVALWFTTCVTPPAPEADEGGKLSSAPYKAGRLCVS